MIRIKQVYGTSNGPIAGIAKRFVTGTLSETQ